MNIDSVNSFIATQYGKIGGGPRKGLSMPKPVQDNASSRNNPNASAKINKYNSSNQNNISRSNDNSNQNSASSSNAKKPEQYTSSIESKAGNKKANEQLSREQRQQLRQLQQREQKVKSHEQAHIAAGGKHVVGGASFEYKRGPDGELYAVGGEVSLDASKVPGDPNATIKKAQTIRKAALAPSDPSGQDRQVAAKARQMEMQARQEKMDKQQKDMQQVISAQNTQDFIDNRPSQNNSPASNSTNDMNPTGQKTMTLSEQVQESGINKYQSNSLQQSSPTTGANPSKQLLSAVV